MCSKIIGDISVIIFYTFLIPQAVYFVFNKSNMFFRLNLVANLMYFIYVNNTLPLALVVHEITRHFWAAYGWIVSVETVITQVNSARASYIR